jgi:hypothetical protein
MRLIQRNKAATYAASPVLADRQAEAYLGKGELPVGVGFLEVPPGLIARRRAVWLVPSYRAHAELNCFLVSTDFYQVNEDPLAAVRSPIYCYYSESARTHYLGRINEADAKLGTERVLLPLIQGLHDPIELQGLRSIGRVIAAC